MESYIDTLLGLDLGNTVERHVGKSDNWLRKRLKNNPQMEAASTFLNEAAANRAQGRFVKKYRAEIDKWLKGDAPQMSETLDIGNVVGRVLESGKSQSVPSQNVFFLLRRSTTSAQGWYFHTSYPVL